MHKLETKAWLDARHQRIHDAYDECERWDAGRASNERVPRPT